MTKIGKRPTAGRIHTKLDATELLVLDVTKLSPSEAAQAVLTQVSTLSAAGELRAASPTAYRLK
jgi:hypothetical protein